MSDFPLRAACLTAPAAGGVAVVQVIGRDARRAVAPFLIGRRALDLSVLEPHELRLCRWMDGGELIDDAIVCARDLPGGQAAVEINLHGGQRIVQRVLLCLQRAGARVVDGRAVLAESWVTSNEVQREALSALLSAKTRRVAKWLMGAARTLQDEIRVVQQHLEHGHRDLAAGRLRTLIDRSNKARLLLEGGRVVLAGEPNAGKSTLANALAEQEGAIVSEVPGTTRDYVEIPGAIDGIPFTFVDTAGLRITSDPIEHEAIRRGREQLSRADVIVYVIDGSRAASTSDIQEVEGWDRVNTGATPAPQSPDGGSEARVLFVWNKTDAGWHAGHDAMFGRPGATKLRLSVHQRHGLDNLRNAILDAVGMRTWDDGDPALFTRRQSLILHEALSELIDNPDTQSARRLLAEFA